MKASCFLAVLALASVPGAYSATMLFTDLAAWQAANPGSASDDFSSAELGGPVPNYTSPLGVTITRSLSTENNGQTRTTTTQYNGDSSTTGQPYFAETSSQRVFVVQTGPLAGDRALIGPEDSYSSMNGWDESNITRFPDGARRRVRTTYTNHVQRANAAMNGSFADGVAGFGLLYQAFAGPFPGTFRLEVNGETFEIPVLPILPAPGPLPPGQAFLGVRSTDPITQFRLTAVRGRTVFSTESYTNRPCGFGPPGPLPPPAGTYEVCLANGSIQRAFSNTNATITELFVADGSPVVDDDTLHATPEPSAALLVFGGIALLAARRKLTSGKQ